MHPHGNVILFFYPWSNNTLSEWLSCQNWILDDQDTAPCLQTTQSLIRSTHTFVTITALLGYRETHQVPGDCQSEILHWYTWNCIREKVTFRLTEKVLQQQAKRRRPNSPWDLRVGKVDGFAMKWWWQGTSRGSRKLWLHREAWDCTEDRMGLGRGDAGWKGGFLGCVWRQGKNQRRNGKIKMQEKGNNWWGKVQKVTSWVSFPLRSLLSSEFGV